MRLGGDRAGAVDVEANNFKPTVSQCRPVAEAMVTWAMVVAGHLTLIALGLFVTSQPPLRPFRRRLVLPSEHDLRPLLGLFALYWAVIAVHLLGVLADPAATRWVGQDYASSLYALEGDRVALFQAVRHPALDAVFSVAYLFGYPFMIYFAPFFYFLHRDHRALRLAAVGFVALYALTLPFYLFLPISNPWAVQGQPWYQGTPVEFRLGALWPDLLPSYWTFTTPNNELPSLHAGISALTALVADRAGYRRFALLAGGFAVLIPLSSFYLGVHWILDALVGEAFAVLALVVALRVAGPVEDAVPTLAGAEAD